MLIHEADSYTASGIFTSDGRPTQLFFKAKQTDLHRRSYVGWPRGSLTTAPVLLIHEADHSPGRPVVITIFTQSVRPSQNFKVKRQSLPAGTVG